MADLDSTTTNFDAEQLKADIAAGEEKAPQVNVEADYELAKQFDVADIDKTDAGAEAAEAATAPQGKVSAPEPMNTSSEQAQGDPNAFREMAKDVNPRIEG
ncbi:MAG: hypothetical protein IGS50_18845 [Synechococcales cyanobacterium C42_A2020_086]|jgi:hypothetical protein|nr:hypothetical protein [Synechococcales cyanobacterium M58_A2018_015]MBF2075797.1 hypothetical protein [Synechococcales cyanobacterium C42_A2020_086]